MFVSFSVSTTTKTIVETYFYYATICDSAERTVKDSMSYLCWLVPTIGIIMMVWYCKPAVTPQHQPNVEYLVKPIQEEFPDQQCVSTEDSATKPSGRGNADIEEI